MMQRSWVESRRSRNQRGGMLVLTAMLLVALTGVAALSVDRDHPVRVHEDLQIAADAASLAAVDALRAGRSRGEARRVARAMAVPGAAAAVDVALAPSDIVFGSYDAETHRFQPNPALERPSAVQVTARRAQRPAGWPGAALFAGLFGATRADVAAAAVASVVERDVVLVQETSCSFLEEIGDAKRAHLGLVQAMTRQGIEHDRVGLVSFSQDSRRELELTGVGESSTIADSVAGLDACRRPAVYSVATDVSQGLATATAMLRAEGRPAQQVIVMLSDGMPFPDAQKQPAIDAADEAEQAGISIFSVTLTHGSSAPLARADVAFNADLVRGFGLAYDTANPADLDDLLLQVLAGMPVRLVR